MLDLLRNTYDKAEAIKGRKLINLLIVLFIIFLVIGFTLGYFINSRLTKPEQIGSDTEVQEGIIKQPELVTRQGRIIYIGGTGDTIYALLQFDGSELKLRSYDDKLSVAEGLDVSVVGKLTTSPDDNSQILLVDKLIITN
ncbi:hypothetical protein A3K34_03915 [candidate division WWE3 bacterium RIFOXYC1_FULL_40_10]|uniref:Uncharacterized protein n=1 Tax=candidate division WWE3 bacterium RIFOXYA2_FULL_46_9 TaxID=1802636 RepID=A0A1F4W0N9_UNCKA|nr:MAG: hypothetical protein A3K58_03915 [candidate division WWE3 bacterium RIFOXYB1_FULL_40_22]OGC61987.1 MAG: hypothetical protein A3K37_03915 [candidate division WWE3 bacterium RIFOXYA1_FULL_40_11]OGC62905.1 MAG: hypothetical protein A2264_03435 [candidate division WWE3 bacterium RIFOXYA2_FULL_46_9]OGC65069.1 MAG: hypothetical protein A2326_03460 [candidate division WWE3 bacterium RIFOXYB2_FULL_41_6]OGC66370.1 MAG: hypothetical protein A3K34_03915 [candidate division WWE3 bacterium RIFOXYC1_